MKTIKMEDVYCMKDLPVRMPANFVGDINSDVWNDNDFDFYDELDIYCEQMEEKTATMTNDELFAAREKALENGGDVYFYEIELDSRGLRIPGRDYGDITDDCRKYRDENYGPVEENELPC